MILYSNEAKKYLFANGAEINTEKDSEIVLNNLCLRNGFQQGTWKKWINGHIYDFNVDYDAIYVNDFLDIHKYLTRKKMTQYNKKFEFVKQIII